MGSGKAGGILPSNFPQLSNLSLGCLDLPACLASFPFQGLQKVRKRIPMRIHKCAFIVIESCIYKVFLTLGTINNTKTHALLNTEQLRALDRRKCALRSPKTVKAWRQGHMQHRNRLLEAVAWHRGISRCFAVLLMTLSFLAAMEPRCQAQDLSTGSLNVTVVDSSGALVPGAQLVLKDLGTNDLHKATTGTTGSTVIPFLNPADYSLSVS